MRRMVLVLSFVCLLWDLPASSVYARTPAYNQSYQYYIEKAETSYRQGDYESALGYYQSAHAIQPDRKELTGIIKRLKEKVGDEPRWSLDYPYKSLPQDGSAYFSDETADLQEREAQPAPAARTDDLLRKPAPVSKKAISSKPPGEKKKVLRRSGASSYTRRDPTSQTKYAPTPARPKPVVPRLPSRETDEELRVIEMNDDLWSKQPNTLIEIELNKSVILRGQNIERYLAVTEGFLDIERLNRNEIRVNSKKIGSTFLHVWDDKGRWTVNVTGILPRIFAEAAQLKGADAAETYVQPFKFEYSNTWDSFYRGNRIPEMERQSLTFRQWTGVYGETPYGEFDASANFYKFADTTERVGERIGLTNGKLGPFKDFTIRGRDTSVYTSPLTVPGRAYRGGLLEAYAFHHLLRYNVFAGQDRASYLFVSPGAVDERDSFIEGSSATLFPDTDHTYSFNYARAYGEARDPALKEKVYSIESAHLFGDFYIDGEMATDEDKKARLVNTLLDKDVWAMRVNFRDLEPNFRTITGRPSGSGEVGGNVRMVYTPGMYNVTSNLDVYRDREQFNPERYDDANFDSGLSVGVPLSESSRLTSSVFYSDTPQLLSPRKSLRLANTYNRIFRLYNGRNLTTFVGTSYQKNRFEFSPASEFDRTGVVAGFRLPLFDQLACFTNYDYSWVKEIESGNKTEPNVLTSGLSYLRTFTPKLSGDFNLIYRNEEESEGDFSFLAGEDSLRGDVSFSYRPKPDVEVFLDGSLRNVWVENPDSEAFNDADVRVGVRSAWDMPFSWNPTGIIYGKVYKDLNGNKLYDADEPGVEKIVVKVGKTQAVTNENGEYKTKLKAKEAVVAIDINSIPQGYFFATDGSQKIVIEHLGMMEANFGLTTRTSIYGVIYVDMNANARLDPADKTVPEVRMILDEATTVYSGIDGTYSFENITPGKHIVKLDIQSVPIAYLPMIRLKNEIEVTEGTTYILNVPLKKKGGN